MPDSKCLDCIHAAVCGLDTCFEDGCGRYAEIGDYALVVRCKDCKHRKYDESNGCMVCEFDGMVLADYWFCADGERTAEK